MSLISFARPFDLRVVLSQSLMERVVQRVDGFRLILLALPFLLLAVNPQWPFTNGDCDPWYYFGYHAYFPELVQHVCYPRERFPYILPGYLLRRVLPAVQTEYVLNFAKFYVCVLSMYYLIGLFRDRRSAFVTSFLMGCYPLFLRAIGWDLYDGYGMAYYLLTLVCLTRAARPERCWFWLTLAGAGFAAQFFSNPIWLVLAPPIPVFFLLLCPAGTRFWSRALRFVLFFPLGFLLVTSLFVAIHYWVVGDPWYYRWSLYILRIMHDRPEWQRTGFEWIRQSTWLVCPASVFIATLGYAICRLAKRSTRPLDLPLACSANYLYCFAMFLFLTFVRSNRVLELDFYVNALLPSMFLALGCTVLVVPSALSSVWVVLATLMGGCLCVTALYLRYPWYQLSQQSLLLPFLIGLGGLLLASCSPSCPQSWLAGVYSFGVACVFVTPQYGGGAWLRDRSGKDLYVRTSRALDVICDNTDRFREKPYYWGDQAPPYLEEYLAVAAASLRPGPDLQFPNLAPGAAIQPGSLVVVLTSHPDIVDAAERTLKEKGLGTKLVTQHCVCHRKLAYWLTFLRVTNPSLGQTN